MPLYEYECQDCGNVTEILQRSSQEDEDLQCPECGSLELRRQFSVFSASVNSSKNVAASCPTGTCPLS